MCAGCDVYPSWGAVVVGAMSGPIFMVVKYILLRFQIDDPLDAIPVHGAGGVWGTITVHLLRSDGPSGIGLAWNLVNLAHIYVHCQE